MLAEQKEIFNEFASDWSEKITSQESVLFEKVKGETSQFTRLWSLPRRLCTGSFQKRGLHISENSMSTQGLYKIEILTTNK